MSLQAKKGNVPSKDKLPTCSTWFRLKAERKIIIQRRRPTAVSKLKEMPHEHHEDQPVAMAAGVPTGDGGNNPVT